jgi:hypothetical protein
VAGDTATASRGSILENMREKTIIMVAHSVVRANLDLDLDKKDTLSDAELLAQIMHLLLVKRIWKYSCLQWCGLRDVLQYNSDGTLAFITPPRHTRQAETRVPSSLGRHNVNVSWAILAVLMYREEIDALPILHAVTMEILRTNAVAPWVARRANKDAVVPLGLPIKGRDGKLMDHFRVSKGTIMSISILPTNVDKEYWGEDAEVFK